MTRLLHKNHIMWLIEELIKMLFLNLQLSSVCFCFYACRDYKLSVGNIIIIIAMIMIMMKRIVIVTRIVNIFIIISIIVTMAMLMILIMIMIMEI